MLRFCLAVCLLIPALAQAQPIKSGIVPGQYLLGSDVLTVAVDGTITLAKTNLQLAQIGVVPPGPTPPPGPGPAPVLNARAQAVFNSVPAVAVDPDRVKNAAGFSAMLRETKAMIVESGIEDATIIAMTLQFALMKTEAALPTGWKATTKLIGDMFNEQQRTDSTKTLTVFDDAIAGLSAAAPGVTLELPFKIDYKTGLPAIGPDGKELANPRYVPSIAAPGAIDWAKLIEVLLPLILKILAMFMSGIESALPLVASLV